MKSAATEAVQAAQAAFAMSDSDIEAWLGLSPIPFRLTYCEAQGPREPKAVPFVSKDILQGRRCKQTMCYKTCKQTCFIWRRLEKRRRDREDERKRDRWRLEKRRRDREDERQRETERQRASRKLLQMDKDLTNLQGTVVDTYELTGSVAERDPLPEGAVGWCACAFCPLPVYPGDGTFCDFCWPVDDCECGCACQCSGHSEEDEDA